jgi:hypothetical protein
MTLFVQPVKFKGLYPEKDNSLSFFLVCGIILIGVLLSVN